MILILSIRSALETFSDGGQHYFSVRIVLAADIAKYMTDLKQGIESQKVQRKYRVNMLPD